MKGAAWAVLLFLCVVVGFLRKEVSRLRSLNERLAQAVTAPMVGRILPPLDRRSLAGEDVRIAQPRSGVQVLLSFNTSCEECAKSIPMWRLLADSFAQARESTQVVALSFDSAAATFRYVTENQLPFLVVLGGRKEMDLLNLEMVPAVVVTDTSGLVRYLRVGALVTQSGLDSVFAGIQRARRPRIRPAALAVSP